MKKLNKNENRPKIFRSAGVSLAELLMAVLIMSIVTLAIAAGVGTAVKVYNASKTYSEEHVLANNALEEIRNVVRFAYDIDDADENSITFTSEEYGKDAKLSISTDAEHNGQIMITYGTLKKTGTDNKVSFFPLTAKTYSEYGIVPQDGTPIFSVNDENFMTVSFNVTDIKTGKMKASINKVGIRLLNNPDLSEN